MQTRTVDEVKTFKWKGKKEYDTSALKTHRN